MRKICVCFVLFVVINGLHCVSGASNTTGGIIKYPGNYIIRSPDVNITFEGNAKFGTPCFRPPFYLYDWYLNGVLIGSSSKFSRGSTDFPPGEYTLVVNVTDCVGRTASESRSLKIVEPLNARINGIEAGGDLLYTYQCVISACDKTACNKKEILEAVDYYASSRFYVYNQTGSAGGSMLYLNYDGSLLYEIDDPFVEVIFPSDCAGSTPKGFFTVALETSTGNYYVLVGEDDFIGGLPDITGNYCKNVCDAFINSFIPRLSDILVCGADSIDPPERVGSSSSGFTRIVAHNSGNGKKVNFIFADDMSAFLEGRWDYRASEVSTGTARLTFQDLCRIYKPTEVIADKCVINLSATVWGGFPPYEVKWISSDDGVFHTYTLADDPSLYTFETTPPMSPPLTGGVHNLTFHVRDSLGVVVEETASDVNLPWCCTVATPCHKYWPGREGPGVLTGNEVSYACDIYEVCRPELWEIGREAYYCCQTDCSMGCHSECKTAINDSSDLVQSNGVFTPDGLKKCAALYSIYGFGPAEKFMTDYFWPELACSGNGAANEECCAQDFGTCSCSWHTYNREAQSLPCTWAVSTSPEGWASDIAMNKNSCTFSDLSAYASIEVLNTGTCCDYANSLTTILRIIGYGPNEVYAANGPGHCYTLVKLPNSPKFNIVDVTGNFETPYVQFGIGGAPGYPYCAYFNCRNDAGSFPCPRNTWGC